MPTPRRLAVLVLCSLVQAAAARAQVLVTGETGGAGGQAVVVSANLIHPKDFGTLKNFWGEYSYGIADRVDVFASYGNISVFGETQHYVGVGSNISILRRATSGPDLSFFNNVSVPFTRRSEASTVLVTLALVASHPVTVGSVVVTPYGGFNMLVPVGQRALGVFTPVATLRTGIVGAAVPLNKSWSLFAEYNPGPHLKSGGVAIVYARPAPPPRP